ERLPEPEPPRRGGYDGEELAEDYQRTIHGGRTPEDALEQARVPSYKTRSEGVAESAGRLENNKGFGTANEAIFNRYLDEGVGEVAERFENLATQVRIEPIKGWKPNGEPIFAGYEVIADNVARDRVTGALVILDAKTARTLKNGTITTAPLSKNQRPGYPLIAANGGRVKSQGLAGELAHHSVIEPTPVAKAKPSIDLAKDPLPPGGRIDYSLEPVTPAGGLAGQQVIPVRPLPHPAATGPFSQAAERSGAEIGRDIATTPPPGPFRRPTEVGEGSLRAADDPAFPTMRNHAQKFAQMPQALAAARAIIAAGDAVNLPAPVILGQLMLLKRRFRWIETFRADPTGPTTWRFMLIASSVQIATADLGEPLVLFHGSPGPGARQLAHAMEDTRQGFASSVRDHDLGQGLYLFEDRLGAAHYAGPGGTILRLELPRPHPDDIADISLQGFGRGGLPGAERELLLARKELEGVLSIDEALALMNRRGGPPLDPHAPTIQMGFFGKTRENVKNFLTRATADPASPFSRNLARAQLFHGTVPPHAMLARGGLGFEYDIIQWRIRQPTDDLRRQIVAQILGR
ncbi:MAG: hypothetical protein MUE98_08960, partial [Rhodobacteraceae bacterium]|nr:hypothetical protein [Paracoccaceae bacterium]